MDFNSLKILKFLCKNKNNRYSIISLCEQFPKISKDHVVEVVNTLYKNNYIKYVTDTSIKVTNKGKTYFSVVFLNWISTNIIAILALIVSIIALFRTI